MPTKPRTSRRFAAILSVVILTGHAAFAAGWEAVHPGGGGQIQGIDFDQNKPGKVFFNSDMEGTSISLDYGLTWKNTGASRQKHPHQFCTTVEPGNSNRVYNGGLYGLEISNDGGNSWSYVNYFKPTADRGSVSVIAVNPNNVNKVFVGHGWSNRADRLNKTNPVNVATGPRRVAYSPDRGASWQMSTYQAGDGNTETYSIQVLGSGEVYLSAQAGIYKSGNDGVSWTRLPNPAGTNGVSRGLVISANGQYLYAVYEKNSTTFAVFATKLPTVAWTEISGALDQTKKWWRPRIDSRDGGSVHHLLLGGLFGNASGLMEATVTWSGTTPSLSANWSKIFDKTAGTPWNYDAGWRETEAKSSHSGYTPQGWPRRIWVSSDEGIYTGDPAVDFLTRWEPRYTAKQADGTYKSRGFESTFNWSMGGFGSFLAQGQADNALAFSFNNGASWKREAVDGVNDVGAIHVAPVGGAPVLVFGGVAGFGGGNPTGGDTGKLWARKLNGGSNGFAGGFVKIGGDTEGKNGMNAGPSGSGPRVFSIDSENGNPNRIYVGTQNGVYRHDNVTNLVNGTNSNFARISNGGGNASVKRLVADPNASGTLFVLQSNGTYRVTGATGANPTWTKVNNIACSGMSGGADLDAWANGSATYLAVGQGERVYFSTNKGGNTATDGFAEVLDRSDVLALHPPSLEPWFESTYSLSVGSIAGKGDLIFVSYESDNIHGYAVLKGTISGNVISWVDWTNRSGPGEAIPLPRARRAKILTTGGQDYFYIATSGMGLFRRLASESGSGGTPPPPDGIGAPTNVTATVLGSTSAKVQWSAVGGAVNYDIQRLKAGDVWRAVSLNFTGGTNVNATGLDAGGSYKFRVKARNAGGQASGWTESNSVVVQ